MADEDRIRVQHAESGGVFETTRRALDEVWASRGWTEVAPDTPLTDQRYQPDGGGEPQPDPTPTNDPNMGVTPNVQPQPGRADQAGVQPSVPQQQP